MKARHDRQGLGRSLSTGRSAGVSDDSGQLLLVSTHVCESIFVRHALRAPPVALVHSLRPEPADSAPAVMSTHLWIGAGP